MARTHIPQLCCMISRSSLIRQQLQTHTFRSAVTRRKMSTMHATAKEAYEKLTMMLREVSTLRGITGLLSWDEMVMMPAGAAGERGKQKASLTGVIYDKETSKELGDLLADLSDDAKLAELDEWARANIRDAKKDFIRSTAIPKDLATRIATHETDAYVAWVAAKKASDFSLFAPALAKWVDLSLEKAKAIDPTKPAYDVLLETYEKGCTSARLEEIFNEVKAGIIPLLAQIKQKAGFISDESIKGSYDIKTQAELCRSVALDIGFDLDTGRLDVSVHPFTGGAHPTDVRMTTRFKEDDLLEGLTGAVHETGHALYEQGRNKEQDGLPASAALSMGVHESQSLLWERMVFLNRPVQTYMRHKLIDYFPEHTFQKLNDEDLYKATNVVKDVSLIRVEADEVNYPLHVIIRYEVEQGLLNGSIKVDQVPTIWNEKMQSYLGVNPPNDAAGCLQDIHWAMGALGYFPTYLIGAACAAQIFEQARKSIPDLDKLLADGDFKPLKVWLNHNIHVSGSFFASCDELMTKVTGKPLDPQIFVRYLTSKYKDLYDLA